MQNPQVPSSREAFLIIQDGAAEWQMAILQSDSVLLTAIYAYI